MEEIHNKLINKIFESNLNPKLNQLTSTLEASNRINNWIKLDNPTKPLDLSYLHLNQLPTIPSNCQSLNSCSTSISLRSAHDVRLNRTNKESNKSE